MKVPLDAKDCKIAHLERLLAKSEQTCVQQQNEIDTERRRIAALERQLAEVQEILQQLMQRSSKNSSVPPSADYKSNGKESDNKGGAKKGHPAHLEPV